MIQSFNWYHEPNLPAVLDSVEYHDDVSSASGSSLDTGPTYALASTDGMGSPGQMVATGERRLIKTGKSAADPYMHTIYSVKHGDFGKYVCVIENVVGRRECSAYLSIRSAASTNGTTALMAVMALLIVAAV